MAYLCDGELVCEQCAVDVTDDDYAIPGESDSPCHCSYCHRPLFDDFGLTSDGERYVLESIRAELKRGCRKPRESAWNKSPVWEHGYYIGMPWREVSRDWAEYLLDNHHGLERRDKRTLELFMCWTQAEHDAALAAPAKGAEAG